jgi:Holliday junction resolvasome RuvABC endonuclease subunit
MDEDYDDPQPPKTGANQIKSVKSPDVGFLCVSQKVHTEDTTDDLALAVVHRNGPRHINQIKSVKPPDVGFLCVSQKVHTEDTTDDLALAVVH